MPKRIKSAFTFDRWDGTPRDTWEGAQLSHTRAAKTFTGEMTGTSSMEAIMLKVGGDGGPAVYVAVEKLEVELDGRKGSFFLVHSAIASGDDHDKSLKIVPGSGTGDLVGISGEAEILPGHDFVLDYDLDA
jgi:hypothetical protein